jgi:CSLREA domain-containing protein
VKKGQLIRKQRCATPNGVCFEPLEPRLLLSGSWGAGVDVPSHDSQASTHGGFTQETVVISENIAGSGTDALTQTQTVPGTLALVDVLSQAPVLSAVNAVDRVLEAPSTADLVASATVNNTANETGSDSDMQPNKIVATGIYELVFVNENIADYQQLIADLQGENSNRVIEVVVLDTDRDGIEQVSDILAGRTDLTAVHFVTHGTEGQINLGSTWLNSATLQQNSAAVTGWGNALTAEGDILFYGCNVAGGDTGQSLLNKIARLTRADVAASDDLTGNLQSGGDWVLEYQNGEIDTNVAFSPDTQQDWSGVLATFTVNTTADTADANPGDGLAQDASGNTSLRAAIMEANASAGADNIVLGSGTYTLSLTGTGENAAATGDLDITDDLILAGDSAKTTFIDGAAADRVFDILGSAVTISGITIQNGSASDGGGIRLNASSSLTLHDAAVSDNHATNTGGGILVSGLLTLNRVTIEGNSGDVGGGIYVNNGASASLINDTLSGNSAVTNGGAIFTKNTVDITNSTIAGNDALAGAGGIHFLGVGNASLKNTILANNAGGNANGALISLGNNIDSDGSALLGDPLDSVDPILGPLADNGGTTRTHALLPGSPAINAGTATGAPTVDQRGIGRDATPDIGAFEYQNNALIVDTTNDTADGNTSSITALVGNKGADGHISLREAIIATNNTANLDGPDWILFNISGSGTHTIAPTSALPAITDAVIIDAWSEPDFAGIPVIELNGTFAGSSADGLRITSGGVTIRGLVINRFSGNGIIISGTGGNTVQGNYLGTNAAGSADLGNSLDGIRIDDSANNVIGGTTTQTRNIISGNNVHGVRIIGPASNNNTVLGNYIGVNAAGSGALGNSYNGIWVAAGASNNLLGGTAPGAGNVISGNSDTGLEIQDSNSTGNRVEGNIIGLNAAGTAAVANLDGVIIEDAPHNTIGGATSAQRNVISGNTGGLQGNGVVIFGDDAIGNLVQNNYIGTDITGSLDLGNAGSGVLISDNGDGGVFKGGASGNTIRDNVLSGNNYSGVSIANAGVDNNFVLGNFIGADASGLGALGNSVFGVVIWNGPRGNQIGETAAGEGNVIAFNNRGVIVDANSSASMNTSIRGNSIHSNVVLGIDLGNDGVTVNDPGDLDLGPNGLRNYPVITSAVVSGTDLTLTGTLATLSFLTSQIDFYWSPTGDLSGHGEGQTFIGTATVTTDVLGDAGFNVTFIGVSVPVGAVITATATDMSGNTSEFALNVTTTKGNEAPVIDDQSFSADENAANGTVVGIVLANDPDAGDSLTYAITAGNTGSAFAINASTGQITVNNSSALDFETTPSFSLTVEVSDNGTPGLTDTASVTINLNNINDVPVGAPTITGLVLEDQTLTADTSGITDDDGIGAFSYQWRRDGINIAGATAGTYSLGDADVGAQISVQVSYSDGQGTLETLTSAPTAAVANVNDLPVGVPVITGTVAEDQTLTADTSGISDADGLGAFSYQWRRDGINIAGATADTYSLGDADVGAQISVQVSYTDGQGTLETLTSAPTAAVANVNDAPSASGIYNFPSTNENTISAAVQVGGIFADAAITAVDPDGDTLGIAVFAKTGLGTWEYSTDGVNGWTAFGFVNPNAALLLSPTTWVRYVPDGVHGETAGFDFRTWDQTMDSASTNGTPHVGDTVPAAGGSGAYSNGSASVVLTVSAINDAPVAADDSANTNEDTPVTVNVVANDTDIEGDTLTVSAVTQGANGVVTFAGGAVTYTPNANFNGSDSFTYTVSDGNGGTDAATVDVTVNPVNDPGSVTIDNSAPTQGDTLTANVTDADGATGAITYQWFRNGVAIGGASGKIYTTVQADVGAVITVTADYTDDLSSVESLTSGPTAPVTNANDPGMVAIDNLTPVQGDTLTASVSDADGATGAISYQWYRDGGAISGATGATYTTDQADVGAVITVVVVYTDDQGTFESVSSAATAVVTNLNDAPTASNLNAAEAYTEDIPLNLADIVIVDVDSAAVSVSLTLSDPAAGTLSTATSGAVTATYFGGVWTASGLVADVNALLAGVVFTPSANYDASFTIAVSIADGVAAPITGVKIVTGTPVGDTPQVSSTTTPASTQSGLIVIDRNAADGAEVTHFRIADITNGTLYLADGITPIHDGDYITVAQGQAGVRFTPAAHILGHGSFTVESSEDGVSVAQQSGAAISVITVIPPPPSPTVTIPSGNGDTSGPEPDTAPEASKPAAEPEAASEETVPETVTPAANRGPAEESVPQHRGLTTAPMPVLAQAVRYISQMRAAGIDVKDIVERLSDNLGPSQKAAAADTGAHRAELQAGVHNLISARAYLNMVNSLDAVKKEMASDNQLKRVYLGSAIVSSIGLSVGYVVWLIRGGLLLSSLLSSLPAWQILDPLPILARKKGDDPSEDDESLESILDRKPPEPKPKKEPADASSDAEEKKR